MKFQLRGIPRGVYQGSVMGVFLINVVINDYSAATKKIDLVIYIQRLEDSSNVIIQTLTESYGRYALLIGSPGFQNCINKCFCCIFS